MTKISRFLPKNEYDAAVASDSPTTANPFATVGDVAYSAVSVVSVTIAVADWSGGTTCTKAVAGVTTTSVNQFDLSPQAEGDKWGEANIYAVAQAANSIDFTCETTPTASITFKVIICLI